MSTYDPGSYNKSGFIIFLTAFGFSIAFLIFIAFMHPGVENLDQLREQAKAGLESDQAKTFDITKVEQPWKTSEELVVYGHSVYQKNCQVCHGPTANGDGIPNARNFVKGDWKKGGSSVDLMGTLQNGLEGTAMASFSHLDVKDRWAVVHWIRSITKNAPKDDMAALEEFAKTAK